MPETTTTTTTTTSNHINHNNGTQQPDTTHNNRTQPPPQPSHNRHHNHHTTATTTITQPPPQPSHNHHHNHQTTTTTTTTRVAVQTRGLVVHRFVSCSVVFALTFLVNRFRWQPQQMALLRAACVVGRGLARGASVANELKPGCGSGWYVTPQGLWLVVVDRT